MPKTQNSLTNHFYQQRNPKLRGSEPTKSYIINTCHYMVLLHTEQKRFCIYVLIIQFPHTSLATLSWKCERYLSGGRGQGGTGQHQAFLYNKTSCLREKNRGHLC